MTRGVLAAVPVPRDGPSTDALLQRLPAAEQRILGERASPRRRAEFAAGRAAAHQALQALLPDTDHLVILRDGGERRGRPYVVAGGVQLDVCVSITHADGVALALAADVPAGVDVVTVEDHGPAFAREAFAPGELEAWFAWLPSEPSTVCTVFAFKEAVLKWLGTGMGVPLLGLRVEPRDVEDVTAGMRRVRLKVWVDGRPDGAVLFGWFRASGQQVVALVGERPDLELRW